MYVWCLPSLTGVGFAHECLTHEIYSYPHCYYDFHLLGHVVSGVSISQYIASPQATAVMAVTFAWPSMYLFLPPMEVKNKAAYITSIVFLVFWACFLAIPITVNAVVHVAFMQILFLAAKMHMWIMLHDAKTASFPIWGVRGLSALVMLSAISGTFLLFCSLLCIGSHWFGMKYPYAIYVLECVGLSLIALWPAIWVPSSRARRLLPKAVSCIRASTSLDLWEEPVPETPSAPQAKASASCLGVFFKDACAGGTRI